MLDSQGLHLGLPQASGENLHTAPPLVTPSATVLVQSPFFLQSADNVSPRSKLKQFDGELSVKTPVFPLTKLPVELQLRVLWHCLVSSLPILNAGIPKDDQIVLVDHEKRGQRRINPSIIHTCRAYHHEGVKLLYASNHFLYTCKRPLEHWHSESGINKNVSSIEKLILRPLCRTDSQFPHTAAVISMYWLRHFKKLKTLQIDFCGTSLGYQYDWQEDEDSMSLLVESVDNLIVERMHDETTSNGLSKLTLTGLPENDIGLFVLKTMSLLMRKGGQIGIGTGQEGKSYRVDSKDYWVDKENMWMTLINDRPKLEEIKPQIHWICVEDVTALIEGAASNPRSIWLTGDPGLVSRTAR
ncbi:MAG: hypothetical protein Q9201_001286 [Fulgogasparrea decipioides]